MFISNVRIASADTDARSLLIKQLMEDGKAVTSDILFDVNSDQIKKTSFAIIDPVWRCFEKSILKIKITGHTDADGNDAENLLLSKKKSGCRQGLYH